MARRWWVRGVVWSGIGLSSLIGVLLVVLVLVTQSAFGRERVRQIAERIAARYLLGSLHLGALRFGPGCALAMDSAALRDADDSLLVALGPTRATCAFGALVRGRLVVTSLDVARPNVVARQSASGVWNWSRAFRPDTSPPQPSTGPAKAVVAGPVRVSGGAVVLEVPWGPADSLRGAARDRAIDSALTTRSPIVRRNGNTLVRRREFSGIAIDAPLVRTQIGDTTASAVLNGLAVVSADPAITVHRIAGRIAVIGSSADADLPQVVFNASAARARGHVDWSGDGAPAIRAVIDGDTLAFADVAPLVPNVPGEGGGRFQLAIETAGGTAPTEYRVTSADLHTTRSVVRGGVTLELSGSNELTIRDVALDLAPLHTDLVRIIVPAGIPAGLRGALTARVVARGTSTPGGLRIDTLHARYADEAVPGSASRLTARGTMTLGGDAGVSFSRLVVALDPVDVRTIERLVPALSPLSGRLTGRVTLDSTIERLRLGDVDLRYAEGAAPPLRVTGGGSVDLRDVPRFDIAVHTRPFSPAALARSFPALATLTDVDAQVEVLGSAQDLTFATTATSVAGSVSLAGRYRNSATGVAIRATGNVRDLNPRSASGRASVPAGNLAAHVDVDVLGESFAKLRGSAALTNVGGTLGGVTIEPSVARVGITDSRVVAESVVVATSAGVVSARGALGLRTDTRDTLAVTASLELATLAPLLRTLGVVDTAGSDSAHSPGAVVDSIAGTVTARAHVTGSLDSLDGSGEVEATAVTSPFATARRLHATWAMAGLRSRPRGRASLQADSLAAGGVRLAAATAAAESDDGKLWRVSLGTATADRPGGTAAGTVVIREDTVAIGLDSMVLRVPGTDLHLTRPSGLRRVADGTIILDTLQLRGTRGAVITASGFYRDTGQIAVALDLANAPAFIPGPGGPGDSVRVLLDATARLEGTAQTPRGAADIRAHVADDDSLPIDSVVAHLAYADDRAQVGVDVHARTRSLLSGRANGAVHLSLSPFKATTLDAPVTGQLAIDSLFLPDISSLVPGARFTGGVLRTNITLSGTARQPRAVGNASLAGGAAHIAALGIEVHDANARLDLASDRITIGEASVRAGRDREGRADLDGTVELADSGAVALHLRTSSMPVMRLPETADLDVTSDLRLVGPRARPTLSGRVTVDQGVLRLPDMGRAGVVGIDDSAYVRLVDSLAPARLERASTAVDRFAIGDVQVVMGPNVWLRSAEASVQLGGSIGLEPAAPGPGVAEGQVALRGRLVTQRGNYRLNIGAFTRSFELEEGSVQFTGEPELNPRLDINALYSREGSDGLPASGGRAPKVRAHLGGTLERPVLTLSSADSKLTQAELMSYLVTGQANSALGNALDESVVTSELVASATGALAQRLAGGMFDVVNVTPGATTDDNANRASAADMFSSSRLGVGKQLSSRVFLKVDAGLCALTGGTASADIGQTLGVSLDYRFRPGVHGSVSSAPSTNGSTCANQAAGRGTALTPRQWGLDFTRIWRF